MSATPRQDQSKLNQTMLTVEVLERAVPVDTISVCKPFARRRVSFPTCDCGVFHHRQRETGIDTEVLSQGACRRRHGEVIQTSRPRREEFAGRRICTFVVRRGPRRLSNLKAFRLPGQKKE